MIALPPALGGAADMVFWRLDAAAHAAGWDTGIGAFRGGGRWNSRGVAAVYAALDPATAILEVAVHKGFDALDVVPHVMTSAVLREPSGRVHVVRPDCVPNPNWLVPGLPTPGQQAFGDALLRAHAFVLIPSVVSRFSWNLVFEVGRHPAAYARRSQDRFALDPRLAGASAPSPPGRTPR